MLRLPTRLRTVVVASLAVLGSLGGAAAVASTAATPIPSDPLPQSLPAFVGCDKTESEHKVETKTPDTTVKQKDSVTEKPNGTVVEEHKQSVDRPGVSNDSKTEVKKTTEKDGDTKVEVKKD